MRSIDKFERCKECAKKCTNQAMSMHFAVILAPSKQDAELCKRKYKRAVKHAHIYNKLANYYGGNK